MKQLIAAAITAAMVTACGSGGADPVTTTGPVPTAATDPGVPTGEGSPTTVTTVVEEPDAATSTAITTPPDVDKELAEFDELGELIDELDDLLADL